MQAKRSGGGRRYFFEIRQGELFGLLGPNGAGKTTTVKMLTTLLIPSAGSASILGLNVVREAEQVLPLTRDYSRGRSGGFVDFAA